MTHVSERHLRPGGDPRTLADYTLLRDEMNKLTHPARPDVDWSYAETLCLNLFDTNGADLQTAAWYTLVRTHRAGLAGMNEGLALLEALITRAWGHLWPQPVHARTEILASLGQRLQQHLRTLTPVYADLGALYQAETHLSAITGALQRLALKHRTGLDGLCRQIYTTAVRLERGGGDGAVPQVGQTPGPEYAGEAPCVRRVSGGQPVPVTPSHEAQARRSTFLKPFLAGVLTTLVAGGLVGWGIPRLTDSPARQALMASVAPLPGTLPEETLMSLQRSGLSRKTAQVWLTQARQQLAQLSAASPVRILRHGNDVVREAQTLWPEHPETTALVRQWQQAQDAAALPQDSLNGWHEGMRRLQQLAQRLDGLDEQKGRYMTVSELKSQVFALTRDFGRTVPVEEQLRQMAALPDGAPVPEGLRAQTQQHLKQLLVRYVQEGGE
ncbi:TPA: hypothetical protein I8Y21_005011 [Klebsiella oxytoca]|uniref:Type VI secretion system protein VasL n=1 Tax=Klebsiella oxytoca TaxID=571 RepID=A0AAN5LCY0_KLEOX|nr:hypothetical protein [Klebsiella oxytoca]